MAASANETPKDDYKSKPWASLTDDERAREEQEIIAMVKSGGELDIVFLLRRSAEIREANARLSLENAQLYQASARLSQELAHRMATNKELAAASRVRLQE
jgi:hypothetical protein